MDAAPNALDPATYAAMKHTYIQMLSAVVEMARLLGEPCPIKTRDERRQERERERYSRPS